MSEPAELPDADLETQLRGLFEEAEQKIQGRVTPKADLPKAEVPKADVEREAVRLAEERALKAYTSLPQMLRPMVLGLEAISRATGENAQVLQRLDRTNVEATQVLQRLERTHIETTEAHTALPKLIQSLESLLDQKNGVSQRMFDALHVELKDYKDGFLLESILKPIIRDLVSLYDDLATIHRQMEECVGACDGAGGPILDRVRRMETNLAHHCEFVVEILARLEVTMMPIGAGRLDKQAQRAVAIEVVDNPELDMMVVRTVKRGFMWKTRVLRAEEVVMNKFKPSGASTPAPTSVSPQT